MTDEDVQHENGAADDDGAAEPGTPEQEFAEDGGVADDTSLPAGGDDRLGSRGAWLFAVAAALAVYLPELLRVEASDWLFLDHFLWNFSLVCFGVLTAYVAWMRRCKASVAAVLAAVYAVLLLVLNLQAAVGGGDMASEVPSRFANGSFNGYLVGAHLWCLLVILAGVAYVGGSWRSPAAQRDAVKVGAAWLALMGLLWLGMGQFLWYFSNARQVGFVMPNEDDFLSFLSAINLLSWLAPSLIAAAGVWAARLAHLHHHALYPILRQIALGALCLAGVVLAVAAWTMLSSRAEHGDIMGSQALTLAAAVIAALMLLLYTAADSPEPLRWRPRDAVGLAVACLGVVTALLMLLALVSFWADREGNWSGMRSVAELGLYLLALAGFAGSATGYIALWRGKGLGSLAVRWPFAMLPVYGVWVAVVVLILPLAYGLSS